MREMVDFVPFPPPPPPPPPPPLAATTSTKKKNNLHHTQRDPGGINSLGNEILSGADPDGIDESLYKTSLLLLRSKDRNNDNIPQGISIESSEFDDDQVTMFRGLPTPARTPVKKYNRLPHENQHDSRRYSNIPPPSPCDAVSENNMPETPIHCNMASKKNVPQIDTGLARHAHDATQGHPLVCDTKPLNPILALLVGNPPPPPPSPPPNKTPKRRKSKTSIQTPTSNHLHITDEAMVTTVVDKSFTLNSSSTTNKRSEYFDDGDNEGNDVTIDITTSNSFSTITQITFAGKKDESPVLHEALIVDLLPSTKARADVIADPPAGGSHIGRQSSMATPRSKMQQYGDYNAQGEKATHHLHNSPRHHDLHFMNGHHTTTENPMPMITVNSPSNEGSCELPSPLSVQEKLSHDVIGNDSFHKISSFPESYSKVQVGVQTDLLKTTDTESFENKIWADSTESDNSTVPNPSHINLVKTSVPTIEPAVEVKKDTENFHPHTNPSLRATVKKYRSKTPEKLRRINESKSRSQTPKHKNTKPTNSSSSTHNNSSSQSSSPGSIVKKGFFRKLFQGKRKKKLDLVTEKTTKNGRQNNHDKRVATANTTMDLNKQHDESHITGTITNYNGSNNNSNNPNINHDGATFFRHTKDALRQEDDFFVRTISPSSSHQRNPQRIETNTLDHHPDIFFGNDEVSTLTNPTVDSFHPLSIGTGMSHYYPKVSNSGSHSMHSLADSSFMNKNTFEMIYPRGRRQPDPSIQSNTSSDPLGKYMQKDGTNAESDNRSYESISTYVHSVSRFADDKYRAVSSQENSVDSQSHEDGGSYNHHLNHLLRVNTNNNSTASSNASTNDPIGESPVHGKTKRPSSPRRSLIRAQIKAASSPGHHNNKDPSPSNNQRDGIDFMDNDPIVPLHNLNKNVMYTHIIDGLTSTAPDPPLNLKMLDDALDCTTTEDELSEGEEKKDDDMVMLTLPYNLTDHRWKGSKQVQSSMQLSSITIRNSPRKSPIAKPTNNGGDISTGTSSMVTSNKPTSDPEPNNSHAARDVVADDGNSASSHDGKSASSQVTNVLKENKGGESSPMTVVSQAPGASLKLSSGKRLLDRKSALLHLRKNRLSVATSPSSSSTPTTPVTGQHSPRVEENPGNNLPIVNDDSGPIDSDEIIESLKLSNEIEPLSSSTSSKSRMTRKQLDVGRAARLNAKTIAFIATLNGDPSPRRLWKQKHLLDTEDNGTPTDGDLATNSSLTSNQSTPDSDKKDSNTNNDDELSPTNPIRFFRNRAIKVRVKRSPRKSITSPLGDSDPMSPECNSTTNNSAFLEQDLTEKAINNEISAEAESLHGIQPKFFSAYNPKFKGRKPVLESKKMPIESPRMETDFLFVTGLPKHHQLVSPRPILKDNIDLTSRAFKKGVDILRENRDYDIALGRDQRVVPQTRVKVPPKPSCYESEPKDPIQRAGRRLLAKAAVPIQAGARAFLARREAVDRMWGLLEIQSYMRRWKAESAFLAYRSCVLLMQSVFRGYQIRKALRLRNKAAVTIQKLVRGFLTAVMTYELVYRIILVQAQVRGFLDRACCNRLRAAKKAKAQAKASMVVQTWWRCRSTSVRYKYLLADTIKVQSFIRQWAATRLVESLRIDRRHRAAVAIQKVWRCFMAYTDYIFCVVDILSCQRIARIFLAKRKVAALRKSRAALKIQTKWRQRCAYRELVMMLVYILIIQRNVRVWKARKQYCIIRRNVAATKIQTQFRRLFLREFFLFKLEKILLLQQTIRTYFARTKLNERSAIVIQSQWRCHSAQMVVLRSLVQIIIIQSVARRFLACQRIGRISAAIKIQSVWRRFWDYSNFIVLRFEIEQLRQHAAAVKIQTAWRRFWDYSNFLVLRFEIEQLQQEAAAVKLQYIWRKFRDLSQRNAAALAIQSNWRRNISQIQLVKKRTAVIKIQSTWRRFWHFSHYVILRYELVRLQARIRGKIIVDQFKLCLGCCILIQAEIRRYVARKHFLTSKEKRIIAVRKIQSQWRIRKQAKREKAAALIIERFFLMIKAEIEREIVRREKRRSTKNKSHRERRKVSADKLLEQAWSKTVDGSNFEMFSVSPSSYLSGNTANNVVSRPIGSPAEYSAWSNRSEKSFSSSHVPRVQKRYIGHRPSSPTMNLVMRHECDDDARRLGKSVDMEEEVSIVSGLTYLTNATTGNQTKETSNRATSRRTVDSEDDKKQTSAAEKYKKMYGIKTSAHRSSRIHHFFADDLESTTSSVQEQSPRSMALSSHLLSGKVNGYKGNSSRDLTLDVMRSPICTAMTPKTPAAGRPDSRTASSVFETPRGVELLGESPISQAGLQNASSTGSKHRAGMTSCGSSIYSSTSQSTSSMQYSPSESRGSWDMRSKSSVDQTKTPRSADRASSLQYKPQHTMDRPRSTNYIMQASSPQGAKRAQSVLSSVRSQYPQTGSRSRSVFPDSKYEHSRPESAIPTNSASSLQYDQRRPMSSKSDASLVNKTSPRHGNIAVMKPVDYPVKQRQKYDGQVVFSRGNEYGMI